ncbi:MAG: UbiD family decarboxylase domain-containing protein, partial [Anaerolineae bacterium]
MPYNDLREFIERLDEEGQLKRVKKEVDWNLELSHIAKLNEEQQGGGSALLFESIKDYPGRRVFISALTARERLAIALDMPQTTSLMHLSQEWVNRIQNNRLPPEVVDTGPCKENIHTGEAVDITTIPAPWFYPGDGGRYLGTAGYLITRNLKTGRLNLGTYRAMVAGKDKLTVFMIKAKDGEIDLRDYAEAGIPMPVAYIPGGDPSLFLCSSTLFGLDESEYDVAGALRGAPVKVVKAECSDLLVPATAEYVIEGEIWPGEKIAEGP